MSPGKILDRVEHKNTKLEQTEGGKGLISYSCKAGLEKFHYPCEKGSSGVARGFDTFFDMPSDSCHGLVES